MRFVAIIILSGGCIFAGYYISERGKKKIRFFQEWKRVFMLLKGEVRYGMTPIGDACIHVSKKVGSPFKDFLVFIEEKVKKREKNGFGGIWEEAMLRFLPQYYFEPNEWEQMIAVGKNIGYLDETMQMRTFDLLIEQIEEMLANAKIRQERDGKVYQTLGIGMGVLFAIVLV